MSNSKATTVLKKQLENGKQTVARPNTRLHPNKISSSRYNLINFIPLNIFHQLSKYSTLFFFFTFILLCIPAISPFSPWPYFLAFLIVVGISMIKDGIEDYRRHTNDREINMATCKIVNRENRLEEKFVMDLEEGEYIYLVKHDEVPADVLVLHCGSSSGCASFCYIDTSNLDGESNLKKRMSPFEISQKCGEPSNENVCTGFEEIRAKIKSFGVKDTGDTFLDFHCSVDVEDAEKGKSTYVGDEKNILLRGSILRNTRYIFGLVVAVGQNTKQCKSCPGTRKGKSLFEKEMDHILLIIAFIYLVMLISTTIIGAYMSYSNDNILYINSYAKFKKVVKLLFSNYILYSYLIPLSLYVMMEVCRFIHTLYIHYDRDMKIDGVKSICRNSTVIEDLGVIDYLLTDKTGTMTRNSMTLKLMHIRHTSNLTNKKDIFKLLRKNSSDKLEWTSNREDEDKEQGEPHVDLQDVAFCINIILLSMLVCNSVEVVNGNYEGISQDELCFLKAIKQYKYEILSKDDTSLKLLMGGKELSVDLIHTVDFTSKRQSMSVVVELNRKYMLLCKGSDQRLLDGKRDSKIVKLLNGAGDYRSLVWKGKELSKKDVEEIKTAKSYKNQSNNTEITKMVDRHLKDASYLGTTFIEDELQEEVPETMRMMEDAGIKVWMVTGDKRETALSCARNAGLIRHGRCYREMEGREVVKELEELLNSRNNRDSGGQPARMISTVSDQINRIIYSSSGTDPSLAASRDDNLNMSRGDRNINLFDCACVVIYRTTPSQKGQIASLMAKCGKNTIAIGDGNNDVAMLKDSHVGVGIIGKEGTQASLVADFAIPRFKLIRNLLLVHGRYNLMRYSKMSINAYYKNLVFIFIQYFYNFYNGASGRPIYNAFFLNYYNLFFTSLIPFSVALFDRDVPVRTVVQDPCVYKHARSQFCRRIIWINIVFAILESAVIFFCLYAFLRFDLSNSTGRLGSFSVSSTLFSIIVFSAVIFRQIKQTSFVVVWTYLALGLSILFYLVMLFGLQEIGAENTFTMYRLLGTPSVYFIMAGLLCLIYGMDSIFSALCERIINTNNRGFLLNKQ
ncbi:phospholipid-translocating ATPase [Pancytospora epiphaga]|nr:phospholipid-translocating ATPase [Pancytospora epiphaga]